MVLRLLRLHYDRFDSTVPERSLLHEHQHRLSLPLRPGVQLPGLPVSPVPMLLNPKSRGGSPPRESSPAPTSAALNNLLERRASFLAFVKRRVRDPELAEDILQAAYVRALETSSSVRDDGSVVAWFYAVLRNAIVDHFRRSTSESSAYTRWAQEFAAETDTALADDSTRNFVCGCLEHVLPLLRPAYAELLREVDLNETPLAAFAQSHRLTTGNAAVRAHRARAALRKQLSLTCGVCSTHACLDCSCKHAATHDR